MIWDIILVTLLLTTLALQLWGTFSKKKKSIDRRLDLSGLRVICLVTATMITFFEGLMDALLLQTSTARTVLFCILVIWLAVEVWQQSILVEIKVKSEENKWVD